MDKKRLNNLDRSRLSLCEALIAIATADDLREEKVYTYADGLEISTRDVIRIVVMQLQQLKKPASINSSNYKIKMLADDGYIKANYSYDPPSFINSGYCPRYIYSITTKGQDYLNNNYDILELMYPDTLAYVGNLTNSLRDKVMPHRVVVTK